MKNLLDFNFNLNACYKELSELRKLLTEKQNLGEQKDILPFFRKRQHLSAFIGSYHPSIGRLDRIAFEFDLFGDFKADLVVGDSEQSSFMLVEFEDAKTDSIFSKNRGRYTPEWSSRFEHGFGQIIDWLWKLSDMRRTEAMESRFGNPNPKFSAMLVVGRNKELSEREQSRLKWRQDKILIDSNPVYCMTIDELHRNLIQRYSFFDTASEEKT